MTTLRNPSFFHSPARIQELNRVAESWLGTPFHPNAAVKGRGVCCQKLVGAILIESGHLPKESVILDGPMSWQDKEPRIEKGMDIQFGQFFENIFGQSVAGSAPTSADLVGCTGWPIPLQAGDVLGIELNRVVQHMAIMVTPETFIHAMRGYGVTLNPIRDATFSSRVRRLWRPVEP